MERGNYIDHWVERWSKGETQWHMSQPHPKLLTHLHLLTQDRDPKDAGTIFVPLCGKSHDLKFLYDQGFKVLGADSCEQVINEFFTDNKMEHVLEDTRGVKSFATKDGRMKILCGDVLKITKDVLDEPVQMVWDRAALVAISKELRKAYVAAVGGLVAPGGRYLLCTTQYQEWFHPGPPYNTPPELVEILFQDRFHIRLIETGEMNKNEYLSIGEVPGKENMHLLVEQTGEV